MSARPDAGRRGQLLGRYAQSGTVTYAAGAYAVMEALAHRPTAVALVAHDGRLEGERLAAVARACGAAGVPLERDDRSLERLRHRSDVEVVAVVEKGDAPLAMDADHALLVRPSQSGNLGTAMRSLVAFGVRDVALVDPLVDDWSPHVVRASVGLRFALRCQVFPDARAYLEACGPRTVYAFDARADAELRGASFERPLTLAFGPEGPPGSPALSSSRVERDWTEPLVRHACAGIDVVRLRIALEPEVESLNLATAVSLAAFEAAGSLAAAGAAAPGQGVSS